MSSCQVANAGPDSRTEALESLNKKWSDIETGKARIRYITFEGPEIGYLETSQFLYSTGRVGVIYYKLSPVAFVEKRIKDKLDQDIDAFLLENHLATLQDGEIHYSNEASDAVEKFVYDFLTTFPIDKIEPQTVSYSSTPVAVAASANPAVAAHPIVHQPSADTLYVWPEHLDVEGGYRHAQDQLSYVRAITRMFGLHPLRQKQAQQRIQALIGKMVPIEGGRFARVINDVDGEPAVIQEVLGFEMQEEVVTQRQYRELFGPEGIEELSTWVRNNIARAELDRFIGDDLPMLGLSPNMVENYRRELNEQLRRLWPIAYPGDVYRELRLPTDQEWQYAASEEETVDGVHHQMEYPGHPGGEEQLPRQLDYWLDGPRSSHSAELGVHRGIRGLTMHILQMTSTRHPEQNGTIVLRGCAWFNLSDFCRSSCRLGMGVEVRSEDVAPRFVRR